MSKDTDPTLKLRVATGQTHELSYDVVAEQSGSIEEVLRELQGKHITDPALQALLDDAQSVIELQGAGGEEETNEQVLSPGADWNSKVTKPMAACSAKSLELGIAKNHAGGHGLSLDMHLQVSVG